MSEHRLTLGQRIFVGLYRTMTSVMVGYRDPFVADYVKTYGIGEFMSWAKASYAMHKMLKERWGPVEAQFVVAFAALWSGCRWCGVGHLLAGNLELYKREGELGPVDERWVPKLQMMRDVEVLQELLGHLDDPRWERMARLVERQYLLHAGLVEEESRDDELLQTANTMWEWVVECTITAMDFEPGAIPAPTPLGKDRKLVQRYRDAREQQALEAETRG
ncbi:MAG: hypothetical protein KDK70_15770 [Myxococcales bacterium]|nr:hypothetical protein [Myxococcales bacterium]